MKSNFLHHMKELQTRVRTTYQGNVRRGRIALLFLKKNNFYLMIFHRLWKEHFFTMRNIGSFFAKTRHFSTESKAPDGSASDSAQYPKNIWPNDNQRCKKKTATLPNINCQIEISTNCVLFWTDNFHNIKTEFSNSKCSLNMVCGWSVFVSCLLPVVLQINWKWLGSLSLWWIDGF